MSGWKSVTEQTSEGSLSLHRATNQAQEEMIVGVKTICQWSLIERFSFVLHFLLTHRPRAYWENTGLPSHRKPEQWMIRKAEDAACHFSFLRFSPPAPVTHCRVDVNPTFEELNLPTQLSLKHCKWL